MRCIFSFHVRFLAPWLDLVFRSDPFDPCHWPVVYHVYVGLTGDHLTIFPIFFVDYRSLAPDLLQLKIKVSHVTGYMVF